MSVDSARREYRLLLEAGELLEIFPDFTGQWSKDKKEFIQYHELNEDILNLNFRFEYGTEDLYED